MKAIQTLTLASVIMLGMNSCSKEGDATPNSLIVTGRILGTETTIDEQYQNPRTRWTVDISPLTLPGWGGRSYQQSKVFNLPDTTKIGHAITFHYYLVPQAQETPWRTLGAWKSLAAARTGTDALPEIATSDFEMVKPR